MVERLTLPHRCETGGCGRGEPWRIDDWHIRGRDYEVVTPYCRGGAWAPLRVIADFLEDRFPGVELIRESDLADFIDAVAPELGLDRGHLFREGKVRKIPKAYISSSHAYLEEAEVLRVLIAEERLCKVCGKPYRKWRRKDRPPVTTRWGTEFFTRYPFCSKRCDTIVKHFIEEREKQCRELRQARKELKQVRSWLWKHRKASRSQPLESRPRETSRP